MSETKTIHQKLLDVRRAISGFEKGATNDHFKFDYVSSNQVLSKIRPLLDSEGILLSPEVIRAESKKEGSQYFTELWMRFTWINVDDPADTIVCDWYGQGLDSGEKGVGKALTYAEKYFMLKFFNIPTDGDDPDGTVKPEAPKDNGPAMMTTSISEKIFDAGVKLYGDQVKPKLGEFVKKETGVTESKKLTQQQAELVLDRLTILKSEQELASNDPPF